MQGNHNHMWVPFVFPVVYELLYVENVSFGVFIHIDVVDPWCSRGSLPEVKVISKTEIRY